MIRVLMVDDDPHMLELTRIFLERSGDIEVDATESVAEALEKLSEEENPHQVVISDYAMPEMDGITFLKAVRSRKLEIPFVLFTGKSREEVVIEALNFGADYYMQKEGDPKVLFTELSHQIRQAADRERVRREDRIQRDLALNLSGAASLSAALKLCVDAAIGVSETDCGTMYLLDRSSGSFVLRHSTGFSPEFVEAISKRRRNPSTSLIARVRAPIYIQSRDRDLPLQVAREREGLRAMAVVPIHYEGDVIGYYSVGTHTSDEVPLSGRSALETIAAMTGNAIVRLQAEEELKRSEEQLRAIFTAAENVSFVITDVQHPEPTVLEFSPGAEKIFGYRRQEVVGETVAKLHLSEELGMFHEMHRQMMEGNRRFSGSATLVRKSGEKFPALFSTYPLSDEKGNTSSILGVSIDVTDQKRMEEALKKSEEHYRAIFENCGTAMAIVEKDGLVSKVNSESEALLGFPPQEIEGKMRWDEFVAEEDREKLEVLFRKGHTRLKTTTAQYGADLIDRWGERKRGLFRAGIIPRTKQYVVSVMNVTEQKRMEEALKKSEEMYRTLVEDLTDLICRFLPDGTLIFANDAYCRYFGKDREELIGQCLMTLIPEEDRQIVWDHLAPLNKDQPVTTCVHRVIAADGKIRWQQWTDRAIFDGEGDVMEFQASGHDITDYKLAEDALKETNKKLNLLGSVCRHDLMNRISEIEGQAQVLTEMAAFDSALQRCASTILDLSKSARRQISFTPDYQEMGTESPLWQRVETLAEMARSSISSDGVSLKVQTGPVEVFADPLMEKVFSSLMENSVSHGEKTTKITISFRDRGDVGVIVFEDDGVGVPTDQKERIFDQDFGKNAKSGLFLAREILGISGISIAETGLEGEGARFEIEIPKEHYRIV
ncbi:MAG TPA: PAS domain S-box protein [Methanothrix sp.]|nr:PAS domain S-box protein [Methanothrix sp.]HPJ84626.1 PAS domain S-box protein [Methanothrix sp.]HPR65805.1 PAS domain S-box protein [Methanothrix sp.]